MTADRGLTIITAFLLCPLPGFTKDMTTVHRVDLDGLPLKTWATATHCTAVCGELVKLLPARWKDLRTRGTKVKRCTTCNRPRKTP